jgi:hypothetical protein
VGERISILSYQKAAFPLVLLLSGLLSGCGSQRYVRTHSRRATGHIAAEAPIYNGMRVEQNPGFTVFMGEGGDGESEVKVYVDDVDGKPWRP